MPICAQQFWIDHLATLETQIIAWNGAYLALGQNGAVFSYTVDTGQNIQKVQRQDLDWIKNTLDGLKNEYAVLYARIYGCGQVYGRPGW